MRERGRRASGLRYLDRLVDIDGPRGDAARAPRQINWSAVPDQNPTPVGVGDEAPSWGSRISSTPVGCAPQSQEFARAEEAGRRGDRIRPARTRQPDDERRLVPTSRITSVPAPITRTEAVQAKTALGPTMRLASTSVSSNRELGARTVRPVYPGVRSGVRLASAADVASGRAAAQSSAATPTAASRTVCSTRAAVPEAANVNERPSRPRTTGPVQTPPARVREQAATSPKPRVVPRIVARTLHIDSIEVTIMQREQQPAPASPPSVRPLPRPLPAAVERSRLSHPTNLFAFGQG